MSQGAYYNEFSPFCAQWLRNLIAAGCIAPGDVDDRSIVDVAVDDLRGYSQHHFFAGVGGWSLAARMAGWPDSRELLTGSPPCQPFSVAGNTKGLSDERHLWPELYRIIANVRPPVFMGEQVDAAIRQGWLDEVFGDLEAIDYSARARVVPARSVGAEHLRNRLWIVAHPNQQRTQVPTAGQHAAVEVVGRDQHTYWQGRDIREPWSNGVAILCNDGVKRRIEPGTPLLAHGIPGALDQTRAFGNAIVPQVAAEIIAAWMECCP